MALTFPRNGSTGVALDLVSGATISEFNIPEPRPDLYFIELLHSHEKVRVLSAHPSDGGNTLLNSLPAIGDASPSIHRILPGRHLMLRSPTEELGVFMMATTLPSPIVGQEITQISILRNDDLKVLDTLDLQVPELKGLAINSTGDFVLVLLSARIIIAQLHPFEQIGQVLLPIQDASAIAAYRERDAFLVGTNSGEIYEVTRALE